jgi:hypothetical protein
MIKTYGTYTVKLDTNSNLITITDNQEMIYGKAFLSNESGSAYRDICKKVEARVTQQTKLS